MKSTGKNVAAIAAVLASLALVPVAAQAYMGDDGPPQSGNHFKNMVKELQLTQPQKQQLKDIFAKNRPQSEPLMKQYAAERKAMRALIQADTVDEAAIRAQSTKISAIEADLAVHRAHVAQEIRSILTPEQLAKAKELQALREKRMDERAARPGKRQTKGM